MRTIEMEKEEMKADGWDYEKTDRNGTRHYSTCKCSRCEGTGYLNEYIYIDGGVCFKCGGSGIQKKRRTQKIMTEEYVAKLEAKRQEKAKAKAVESNKDFFVNQGFNENGKTYVVLGNTYEIKDELKSLGAKYNNVLGWHMPQDSEKYPTIEIDVDDACIKDWAGKYSWNSMNVETAAAKIKEANDDLRRASSKSNYIGTIGEKLEKVVTLTRISSYEVSGFSYDVTYFIYNFVDEDNNIIIWKTTKAPYEFEPKLEENVTVTLKGTIKEHSEWNGEPQTVLTRCKIK